MYSMTEFAKGGRVALPYHILDVFTDQVFGGNPLAVVLEADGLTPARMQMIAREFNLSETVFVSKAEMPGHTARVRIFTPQKELPFAGHPTIGTAVLLAALRSPPGNGSNEAIIALEELIGSVRVGVRMKQGQAPFAEFDAPKPPDAGLDYRDPDRLSSALGLNPSELAFENHRPLVITSGATFAFVPVASLEAMAKAKPQSSHWPMAFTDDGIEGAFLYTRQCVRSSSSFHARMFAPDIGVPEDPATGAAAVGLARIIHTFDAVPDGVHRRTIEQGFEMGRPSIIQVALTVEQEKLSGVRIGGHAVRVAEGVLNV